MTEDKKLWGYPIVTSRAVPVGEVVFGNLADLLPKVVEIRVAKEVFEEAGCVGVPPPGTNFVVQDHPTFAHSKFFVQTGVEDGDHYLLLCYEVVLHEPTKPGTAGV